MSPGSSSLWSLVRSRSCQSVYTGAWPPWAFTKGRTQGRFCLRPGSLYRLVGFICLCHGRPRGRWQHGRDGRERGLWWVEGECRCVASLRPCHHHSGQQLFQLSASQLPLHHVFNHLILPDQPRIPVIGRSGRCEWCNIGFRYPWNCSPVPPATVPSVSVLGGSSGPG